MSDAAQLLLELHGGVLRTVRESVCTHFEGLASASRWLAKAGCRDKKLLKDLAHLDTVAAWVRHVTVPLCDKMVLQTKGELAELDAVRPLKCIMSSTRLTAASWK